MHLELFVHADGKTARATVKAWWVSGKGISHATLMEGEPIPCEATESDPWVLLSSLYRELAARKALGPATPCG